MEGSNNDQHDGPQPSIASTTTTSTAGPTSAPKKGGKKKMDNYTIIRHLGEGAFGEVRLALEKSTNREVAIKSVNIMKTCELNKERHIIRERDLLNELKHPNIIELFTTFKVSFS